MAESKPKQKKELNLTANNLQKEAGTNKLRLQTIKEGQIVSDYTNKLDFQEKKRSCCKF